MRKIVIFLVIFHLFFIDAAYSLSKEERKQKQLEGMQKNFEWWPTDAKPGPVQDEERGGYWWWPVEPGNISPWGNRGYIYVYKIIFDYKEEELPAPVAQELRPSLLIKRIVKNVKIYFDYDKAVLRGDHGLILDSAVRALRQSPEADLLITGNCDIRGSEEYNLKLGKERGEVVKGYMLKKGIPEDRIIIISRGKLNAVAPISDMMGMQKDRNAQFMVAEVEEVMIPYPGKPQDREAKAIDDGKYIIEKEEKVESETKVSKKEYTIQKDDTLWKIARAQLGSGHRWKYLYELNKDKIKNPDKLRPGMTIVIPVE
ncbi:MAG: LysM peptidoglycan-binding domain-containing protein [Candidatus Omnitrophica bacterium]|nr:LysM peptidoglycan-binding domain-containing protein [Candidatus Omnitrophota bacterium]